MASESLRELREKYREMLAMRLEHAAGSESEADVRPRMAALAARFPGALREIDDLELDEIKVRIASLDAAIEGKREVEPWMEAVALFHRLARGALCAKRWLKGRKTVDAAAALAFEAEVHGLAFPEDAREWRSDLAVLAAPPNGRVVGIVFRRVAWRLGIPEVEARERVFGVSRRERASKSGR